MWYIYYHRLEKETATDSNIFAWKIPWTEEPSGLQSMGIAKSPMGLKSLSTYTFISLFLKKHLITVLQKTEFNPQLLTLSSCPAGTDTLRQRFRETWPPLRWAGDMRGTHYTPARLVQNSFSLLFTKLFYIPK